MKWKSLFFVGVIFLVFACQKKEESYQLSNEKWTHLLTDIHISESASQHLSLSLRDSMVKIYLDQILEIHDVPKPIFEKEYKRIKMDPAKLRVVYAGVAKRLNELKLKKRKKNKNKGEEGTKKSKVPKEKTLPQ